MSLGVCEIDCILLVANDLLCATFKLTARVEYNANYKEKVQVRADTNQLACIQGRLMITLPR
jgi:hypothetical protein